jgi:RNA polymerase sigma factor (sigma-70 family)
LLLRKYVEDRDQTSFAELVNRHGGMVLAVASRAVGTDAADVAQAVFFILSQKAASLMKHQNLAGWLYATTHYCAGNVRRGRRRMQKALGAKAAELSVAESSASNSSLLDKLDDGLLRLPENLRQVLLLRYMENLSVELTAAQLGLTSAAVMKRSTRGLSRLRNYFQRQGITSTANGVSSCLTMQAIRLTSPQLSRLASLNITPKAMKLAAPVKMSVVGIVAKLAGAAAVLIAVLATVIHFSFSRAALKHVGTPLTLELEVKMNDWNTVPPVTAFAPQPTAQLSMLTREQILASVELARSQLVDLSVSFTFNATQSGPGDAEFRDRVELVKKGDMLDLKSEYGQNPPLKPGLHTREVSYNGTLGTIGMPGDNQIVAIQTSRPGDCVTQGLGFFDIGMLNDPRKGGRGYDDQSLVSLLRCPGSKIRKQLETVNGNPCYVLDVTLEYIEASMKQIEFTGWLDPARGFLPVKTIYFMGSKPILEMEIGKAAQVLPGLWMPLNGRKFLFNRSDLGPLIAGGAEHVLIVETHGAGKPSILVNKGIRDDFFEIWNRLPAGTHLFAEGTGASVKVGEDRYQEKIDQMIKMAELRSLFTFGH